MKVVDCDTHFWQPTERWEHLIDGSYREQIVEFLNQGLISHPMRYQMDKLQSDTSGKKYSDVGDNVTERLDHMDQEGIDAQIIFPGASRAGMIPDPQASAAACRAVNQWNADFASHSPGRLKPAMVLPMRYPDQALAELTYATTALGLSSAFVAPTPPAERRWSDPALDPVWGAMQDAGVVVCVHEFTQAADGYPSVARASYRDSYPMMYYCGHTVECQLTLMDLMVGGVMERFPRLHFGFIEAHVAWLPGWLAQMDSLGSWLDSYKRGPKFERNLGLLPTEYFRRQCFVVAFPDDAWIAEVLRHIGEDSIALCTDYPHPGMSHKMQESFADSYPDVTRSTRDKLLGGNAVRIFQID
jgi:predicted TIM-barrel fold metal-dependent hydrolase